MYRFISLLIVFTIISYTYGQVKIDAKNVMILNGEAATKQDWLTHTNTENNITVKYPANWKLKTTGEKTIFMLTAPAENESDMFRENINLIVRQLPNGGEGVKMEDIAKAVEDKIPTAVDNFVLHYSKAIKWLGADAKEVAYGGNSKNSGMAVNFIQRITISKGRLVLATYTYEGARDDIYKKTALIIIDNIKCN